MVENREIVTAPAPLLDLDVDDADAPLLVRLPLAVFEFFPDAVGVAADAPEVVGAATVAIAENNSALWYVTQLELEGTTGV